MGCRVIMGEAELNNLRAANFEDARDSKRMFAMIPKPSTFSDSESSESSSDSECNCQSPEYGDWYYKCVGPQGPFELK